MNKLSCHDEFYIVEKKVRAQYLELEIQKIKTGITKAPSLEMLEEILSEYEKQLAKLNDS